MRRVVYRWLLKRARLALADAEHDRDEWGWSYLPSDGARVEALIKRRSRMVRRLSGLLDG